MRRDRLAAALAFLGVILCALPPAHAADPIGPPFGRSKFRTAIQDGPDGADTDDYVARLFEGERLSVSVVSNFQSPLFPTLTLLDPDGVDRTQDAGVRNKNLGKKLSISKFAVDKTGRWAVRIGSKIQTQGVYSLAFRISKPRRNKLRGQTLGGAAPLETTHRIPAIEGATLDVAVKWTGDSTPVELRSLEDPSGDDVPGEAGDAVDGAVTKRRQVRLRKVVLTEGDGDYELTLGIPGGEATYTLTCRVRAPARPKRRKRQELSAAEPYLAPLERGPIEGVVDMEVEFRGLNMSIGETPVVLFDDRTALEVRVNDTGTAVTLLPPPGFDDETVDVTLVNPGGQSYVREDYFYYVPEPVIEGLADAFGAPAAGGSTDGGQLVRLQGRHLRNGQIVTVAGSRDIVPVLRDGELEFTMPPNPPGAASIRLTDRFGHEVTSPFTYEYKSAPVFGDPAYSPPVADTTGTTVVTVTGSNFEAGDELLFDGSVLADGPLNASTFLFTAPALADGTYRVEIRDRFGTIGRGPDFRIKAPGIVTGVSAAGPAALGAGEIAVAGGAIVTVSGDRFDVNDTVTLGGVAATITAVAADAIQFTAPPGVAGAADVVITDAAGQATTEAAALVYSEYADATSSRSPGRSATDDLSALRGATGDLDGDGDDDDLAIVSYDSSPGTRAERTRLLYGDANGSLVDETSDHFPQQGAGADDWNGTAIAIGDLDDANGADILVAGAPPDPDANGELRLFENDGSGYFTRDTGNEPPSTYAAAVKAEDENGTQHDVFGKRDPAGLPTALAIGDLDGDDDLDVVMGRSRFESVYVGVDPAVVDFGVTPPYVTAADAAANGVDATTYFPATRVLLNEIDDANGIVDATDASMPAAGDENNATLPAFHARDLTLGDVDQDGDLDLVLTWDDPTTVTANGLRRGTGNDAARTATRVLLNDGDAVFTDATSTWMPGNASPEYWQAHRLALADLDGDGDLDLVLLHEVDTAAFVSTPTFSQFALRVLRNDRPSADRFTNVTDSVLPAIPSDRNDNYRGVALAVVDVNGDGALDIVVGTEEALKTTSGARLRSTRVLVGTPSGLKFRDAALFLPDPSSDSGEAGDLVVSSDLAGSAEPSLILLTETTPAKSGSSEFLRVFDWKSD